MIYIVPIFGSSPPLPPDDKLLIWFCKSATIVFNAWICNSCLPFLWYVKWWFCITDCLLLQFLVVFRWYIKSVWLVWYDRFLLTFPGVGLVISILFISVWIFCILSFIILFILVIEFCNDVSVAYFDWV